MFLGPGTLYVFRIHQVHCANAVTRPGQAVLLRAAEPMTEGLGATRGPGRLARAFGLGTEEDGADLTRSDVRLVPGPPPKERVLVTPRVGISRGRAAPLRFLLDGNPWVSGPRTNARVREP
jgi:DNA-3-methyladenine glycosylase